MKKFVYEVEIDNVKVNKSRYSFEYRLKTPDGKTVVASYRNKHGWGIDFEDFADMLENGYAAETALNENVNH